MTEEMRQKMLERAAVLTGRFIGQSPPLDRAEDVRALAHTAYVLVPDIESEEEQVKSLIGLFYTAYLLGAEQGPPIVTEDVQMFLDAITDKNGT